MPRKTAETRLKAVEPRPGLGVKVTWSNDFTDIVDLTQPMSHPVFSPFREARAFCYKIACSLTQRTLTADRRCPMQPYTTLWIALKCLWTEAPHVTFQTMITLHL